MSRKGHERTLWDQWKVCHLGLGGGCMWVYIGKNSPSCTQKNCDFMYVIISQ